jgi:hypothetical protein
MMMIAVTDDENQYLYISKYVRAHKDKYNYLCMSVYIYKHRCTYL